MSIRPIHCCELNAFASFSDEPQRNSEFLAYLTQMWDKGYIRPEQCFVAEETGEFIGRIVYWALPSQDNFFMVDFLEVKENANYLEVGAQLLQESLALLHLPAHTLILYTLDTPYPKSTSSPSKSASVRIQLLERLGFSLMRETYRFELQALPTKIQLSERLIFRSLDDVGEDVFINTMICVSSNSLDRTIQQEMEELGAVRYARRHFKTMKAYKYKSTWWQLAYTPDGTVAGLIMPAQNDGGPIIGYIGVVPEQRGQGYVNDLLAQGTFTLLADGAARVRADTDVNNTPMVDAFERVGYKQFALRREYRKRQN